MTDKKRRQMLFVMGATAATVPVSALIGALPSHAAEMVDPESAEAKGLAYVAESEKDDQNCANCALFQADDGAEAGACPLFAGKEVHAAGWCSAYAPKG